MFEALLNDKFMFSSKEDFKDFDTVYENNIGSFKSDVQRMIHEILTLQPSSSAEMIRCSWSAVNFIELCTYYGFAPENFGILIKKVADIIHTIRWYNDQDLSVSVQGLKLSVTLTSIISQSFYKGSYKDWQYSMANQSPFKEALTVNEITNTTRAAVYYQIAQAAEQKSPKSIKDVMRAMYLCDNLYGNGIESLLADKTAEQVEKKLSVLCRVNLDEIATKILGYYQCTSGNQKKRYVAELIAWYESYDKKRVEILDKYIQTE